MPIRPVSRAIGVALLIPLVAGTSSAVRRGAFNGMSFVMTVTMSAGGAAPIVFMKGKVSVSGDGHSRMEMENSGSPYGAMFQAKPGDDSTPPLPMAPGTYTLSKTGSDSVTLVDPSRKRYWVKPRVDPQLAANAAAAQSYTHQQVTNVEISAQRIQPDSTILGSAVQHWRVIDSHAMKTTMLGTQNTTVTKNTFDCYVATDFDVPLPPNSNPALALAGRGADSAYKAKLATAMSQSCKGVPLLMRGQIQMVDSRGKRNDMAMVMTISDVVRGEPPTSLFQIPAGYTRTKVPATAPMFGASPAATTGSTDSLSKAARAAMDSSGTQGTDPSKAAAAAIKSKIGGAIRLP